MRELAIQARDLRKSYGDLEAVRGIDLQVFRGEVFALLGPNGAGKTTTVEILEGHRDRTAGEVSVLGHDPARGEIELKRRIGIVLQSTGVEPYLTVEETVRLFAMYYPHPRPLDEILEVTGLADHRSTHVRKLSGGQQRRLDVAIGLAGDPELLFLDEPTTGFDPAARRGAWEMVKNLQSLGKTVFLTTHYMDEAENLADRVAIIVGGKIVAEGGPRELSQRRAATTIRFRLAADAPRLPDSLSAMAQLRGETATIDSAAPTETLYLLTRWAREQGVELQDLAVFRPSLEDLFLELAGSSGGEDAQ